MTLSVYIAAPYAARELVADRITQLTRIGFTVRCRWADGTHDVGPEGAALEVDRGLRGAWAADDLEDIDNADVFVVLAAGEALALSDLHRGTSGGRHVEMGYALARELPVVFVGEPENVFHALHAVTVVPSWEEAVIELAARLVQYERDVALEANAVVAG